jgi:hypothetical protein
LAKVFAYDKFEVVRDEFDGNVVLFGQCVFRQEETLFAIKDELEFGWYVGVGQDDVAVVHDLKL